MTSNVNMAECQEFCNNTSPLPPVHFTEGNFTNGTTTTESVVEVGVCDLFVWYDNTTCLAYTGCTTTMGELVNGTKTFSGPPICIGSGN